MKTLTLMTLLVALAVPATAQTSLAAMAEARDYRQAEGREAMKALSSQISTLEAMELYERYRIDGRWTTLSPVFGLGNILQGDLVNGLLVGGGMTAGVVLARLGSHTERLGGQSSDGIPRTRVAVTSASLYYPGVTLLVAATAYGFVAPWLFQQSDNAQLREALSLDRAP